ncbi:MAG TPA: STAS domain-containing protein [Gammaproteobacteria bacterium]|nr:STAS domain-containing protein [Gammaproteobacteria bacterium]
MTAPSTAVPTEVVAAGADRLAVRGALTFATARLASETGLRAIGASAARRLEIDFAGVTAADSAGLAVCLVWLARAQRDGRGLSFANLPASVRALARISDVGALLEVGT